MKLKELVVRSAQSADLSLAVGGIWHPAGEETASKICTGEKVKGFSLESKFNPVAKRFDDDGRALLNSNTFAEQFKDYCLGAVRHQQGGYELDKLVLSRARAYLERYKDIQASADRLNTFSKYRLDILNTIEMYSRQRTSRINEAHQDDDKYSKVLKSTTNDDKEYSLERFSHPILDTQLQDEQVRLEASLLRLSAEQEMAKSDNRVKLLQLELDELDKALFDSQLRFLDSFLFSPFDGTITQTYKSFGELVRPGEPILRVENWEKIRLVGGLQTKTIVSLGQSYKIEYSPPGIPPIELPDCKVVSIRGYGVEQDEWQVTLATRNDRSIPPGYELDQRYLAIS